MNTRSKKFIVVIFLFSLFALLEQTHCFAKDSDMASLMRPIALLKDDTVKNARRFKVEDVPRRRAAKSFTPGSKLTLQDTLSIVDTHYPKLLQGHIETRIASARVLEAQGAFDPVYTHISEFKRIQDIVIAGKPKDAIHNEGQLDLPTRSGVQLFGRIRVNPNDSSTPFLQSGRAGEYTGGFLVPLMRGLGINRARALEQKAIFGEPLANINLNLSRMNVLFDSAVSYWDWIAACKKINVVRDLLQLAKNREDLVRGRASDGDLPMLAVAEAEKETRSRQGDLEQARREMERHAFKLSLFLWGATNDPPPRILEDAAIEFSEIPREMTEDEIRKGIERALSVRPELVAISIQKEMTKVDLRLAQNEMLPAVDLLYHQGADTGTNGIGMVFGGGVKMSIPIRQRRARGLIRQAQLELSRLDVEENFIRRRIQLEVQDRASELNAAFRRFNQASEELERALIVERGERQRFDLGDSSLFVVNRRERDRAESERKRIDMYGEYLKALAAFNTVTGQI